MAREPLPNEGSFNIQEVWRDAFGIGYNEFGLCITRRDEDTPWTSSLDKKTTFVLATLFASLSDDDRKELSDLMLEACEKAPWDS